MLIITIKKGGEIVKDNKGKLKYNGCNSISLYNQQTNPQKTI